MSAAMLSARGLQLRFGLGANGRQGFDGTRRRHFLDLGGEDLLQDVAHVGCFACFLVNSTKASTFARAGPEAIASRALAMPSPMLSARLAT